MAGNKSFLEVLSNSLIPEIFGHKEIKKGLLIQLVGGIQKKTEENSLNLRGDIHICIVGEPSTGKSQFLKFISENFPRCTYTNAKTSTKAGLTVSVGVDKDNKNHFLQAGALLLADGGICCIDEFNKMRKKDLSGIHEVMELSDSFTI
ncbi:hypothetical protein IMG5_099680 [Ichthyophthirius multifiliis]|uniref:DNA helicase n=1 Tax=Ichthyophthirius multifiliis TaxID=5932 RepID=G0QS75_ICHMU|nr:hypothetical protein IMG5_099680 [Ichthyophthirius multifiliis]EGR31940.1 hypothetical protein IMG5_099680 [Ichthyophthirius multifiliis]|eukprot:XP_004035426.1 hypothetical protein IMG5_099680 [Ichthyophthirius multifiliis]